MCSSQAPCSRPWPWPWWGGYRYVVWADGSRNCVRLHVMMDTAADAEELATALGTWATRSGATVEGRQPIVVKACN